VRCLRKHFPDSEIHYLTKPVYKSILENNPYINYLHVLDKPLFQKGMELREIGFDVVIDLHRNLRTKILKAILATRNFSFDKLNFEKWLMVNFKLNLLPKLHIVERYMETVAELDVTNDEEGLDYFLPSTVSVKNIPDHFIAFAIGANHFTKKLPNEKIISICKLINKPIVLLGGKEDEQNGDEIAINSGVHVKNFCGKLSLNESAFLIKNSDKVITHDTGLMHIAAAFKKEIISVWGNTIPEFGMTPYYGKHQIINYTSQISNLSCRPCSKIGFDKCPKGHFDCMMMQNVNKIADSVL
jgi:ADP-heptose:LPS heptosyltransferase